MDGTVTYRVEVNGEPEAPTTEELRELYGTTAGHHLYTKLREAEHRLNVIKGFEHGMTNISKVKQVRVVMIEGITGDGVVDPITRVRQFWTIDGQLIGTL